MITLIQEMAYPFPAIVTDAFSFTDKKTNQIKTVYTLLSQPFACSEISISVEGEPEITKEQLAELAATGDFFLAQPDNLTGTMDFNTKAKKFKSYDAKATGMRILGTTRLAESAALTGKTAVPSASPKERATTRHTRPAKLVNTVDALESISREAQYTADSNIDRVPYDTNEDDVPQVVLDF